MFEVSPGKIWGGVLLLLAGAGIWLYRAVESQRPRGSDDQQIRAMVAQCEDAAEARRSGPILRWISENYRDQVGFSDSSVKYQIRDYIRSHASIQIEIPPDRVQVSVEPDGQRATVSFPVTSVTVAGAVNRFGVGETPAPANPTPLRQDFSLSLTLVKERVYYCWVFPGAEWRIVSADGYGGVAY